MPRQRLPNRRPSETLRFTHEGIRYFVQFSRFPDGRLAELFLDAGQVGTPVNIMALDLATLTSIALQYGVPTTEILSALSQELSGEMRGPLGRALQLIEQHQKESS